MYDDDIFMTTLPIVNALFLDRGILERAFDLTPSETQQRYIRVNTHNNSELSNHLVLKGVPKGNSVLIRFY